MTMIQPITTVITRQAMIIRTITITIPIITTTMIINNKQIVFNTIRTMEEIMIMEVDLMTTVVVQVRPSSPIEFLKIFISIQ